MFYDLLIFIFMSYIKPQPIQSTWNLWDSCISYYSYIKPQPPVTMADYIHVVYRTIPTSNHNYLNTPSDFPQVVYRTIPTSNHNHDTTFIRHGGLYIVLFLHQTTTLPSDSNVYSSCISYYSYIKPQPLGILRWTSLSCISYYSYIKPQPINLKRSDLLRCISYYSYIKPQLIYEI